MAEKSEAIFTIGEFMHLCDTTRETLYHYEKQHLLMPTVDPNNGYRRYTPDDYYTFMFIAHLTRIGFSLHEVSVFLTDQTLENYFKAAEMSRIRLEEQQLSLHLRRERTQRGLNYLKGLLSHPLDQPQIRFFEEEYFLKTDFDNSRPIISDVECFSEHDRFSKERNIDIQRHYRGFYAADPFASPLPGFQYSIAKLTEPYEGERLFVRPAGMYITMCYKGPFYGDCAPSYQIVKDYLKNHRFTPLTGMFVEIAVGPFYSKNPDEYIAELSIRIE